MASASTTDNTISNSFFYLKDHTLVTKNKTLLTRWVFTWNNYSQEDIEKLKAFAPKYCKFLIFGFEEAPTTGTKHLQGYIHLLKRLSLFQLKTLISSIPAFYMANKNDLANYRYCSKSENFYFYESSLGGTCTESSKKTTQPKGLSKKERMELAYDLAKQEKFNEIDKDILIQHGKVLKSIKMENLEVEENLFYDQGEKNYFHCHNLWLWGETGTGKSFFITYFINGINRWWERRCKKLNQPYLPLRIFNHQKTKWWCGYMGEEIIVINEVNPVFCSWYANEIKEWVDQYPFNAEVKGSNIGKIRPLFFIFTSNYDLDECFVEVKGREIYKDPVTGEKNYLKEDIKAMHRRMKVIKRTKEDRNKLVRWPNFKDLDEYYDNFQTYKLKMNKINDEYDNDIVKYNNKPITIIDETQKTINKANTPTKKDKGKQPYESPKKRKQTEDKASSSNTSTPQNKKTKTDYICETPKKPEIGICEKCLKYKIKNIITEDWWCELCEKKPEDCTCSELNVIKISKPENSDDLQELNQSFVSNINNDSVLTSTQNESNSIPSSPLLNKSLERQNAMIYDHNNDLFIGEPPSTLDIPTTPILPELHENDSYNLETINIPEDELKEIENKIKNLENDQKVPQLSNSQETYDNIPQLDGNNDELEDEYGNIYKSTKQKYFIEKKIQLIQEINKYIRKIKYYFDKKQINEITFIRKLKEYETKKQKIINEFELFKYHYPDDTKYKTYELCWYCKCGVINACSCTGEYIYDIPAETFEEKLQWIEHKHHIKQLKEINSKLCGLFNEVIDLDDNCFNIWKYKNKIDIFRKEKTNLLIKYPYIKKFDNLTKNYCTKLCFYCNYGVSKFCECSGKFVYTDKNNIKYNDENIIDEDHDFDVYQENN